MPALTKPFVVISKTIGCRLADVPCMVKSYKSRFLIAANSSIIAPDTSKPSRWFVLALSALMVPMFKSQ